MKVVVASSEAVPFSKTGGLADVASSLSKALDQAGHDVWLITPHYPQAIVKLGATKVDVKPIVTGLDIRIGSTQVPGTLLQSKLDCSNVTVLLVDQPAYYDRPQLYFEDGQDYSDNCERFVFFSRAVMETVHILGLEPDILHLNDWQTGLVPAILTAEFRANGVLEQTASVFTIHNIAFQGEFWHWDMALTGLDWKYFNWRQMEFFERLNLLKTGIAFADYVTTVSPTYAKEIRTPEWGCRLDGAVAARSNSFVGILNGVDTELWNPQIDPHIARNYSIDDFEAGKAACKRALQEELGLPARHDVPLLGIVSRLTEQKGFDLIVESVDWLAERRLQMVVLGSGVPEYEAALLSLSRQHPQKFATIIGMDEPLAHRIEAGADAYLMPSRFEPCGLNQMYSLIYGTVPVVHRVGGLADTVIDANPQTLAGCTATGFAFDEYDSGAFRRGIVRALEMFTDKPKWQQLIRTGMQRDWSWGRSAAEYVEVYKQAHASRTPSTAIH